jgi:DNA-binding CsgD family transcriptional regulator
VLGQQELFETASDTAAFDLRGHKWDEAPIVPMNGKWVLRQQPQSDLRLVGEAVNLPHCLQEYGNMSYSLRLRLDSTRPPLLSICVPEFLTAFEMRIGNELWTGAGKPGPSRETTVPGFGVRYFPLPNGKNDFTVTITGANFHHRQGGMVTVPLIGPLDKLLQSNQTRAIWGGILIGLLFMNSAYQFMLYGYRREERAKLYNALCTLFSAIHFLCLNDRWLYQWLGEGNWGMAYKVELLSLFGIFATAILFFRHFFHSIQQKWLFRMLLGLFGLQAMYVIVTPTWIAAWVDWTIPFTLVLIAIAVSYLSIQALLSKEEGARLVAASTAIFVLAAMASRFVFATHVGGIMPLHMMIAAYVLTFSWILSRESARRDRQLEDVSKALEKTNAQLADHNTNLESEIARRTQELVAIQQIAHQLELSQKQRDLEALHANNQMKVQLTRNLIEELQGLLRTGGDYQSALKGLISGLHGQIATQERLNVLQEDLETINAEFYRRLQAQYPQLSKTEREICAYLKLNLSGKDIAMLRKTSINTVNVARHRIRKKLGLERDEELEAFMQGF